MKVGDKVDFYLFGVKHKGEIYQIDSKEKLAGILFEGFKYPNTRMIKKLPKNKNEIPPWYMYI